MMIDIETDNVIQTVISADGWSKEITLTIGDGDNAITFSNLTKEDLKELKSAIDLFLEGLE